MTIFKKTSLLLALMATVLSYNLRAQHQDYPERLITIDVTKSITVPADLIIFNINLNIEAKTPKEAFDQHKVKEDVLASLLKDLGIKEANIRHQPININKRYRNDGQDLYSQTSQSISVTFSDFDIYEKVQITLIENGFDSFDGSFSSSKIEEGKKKALETALNSAKERAQFIANNMGVKVGKIKRINYSDYEVNPNFRRMDTMAFMKDSAGSSMLDFAQSVTISASVHTVFDLE